MQNIFKLNNQKIGYFKKRSNPAQGRSIGQQWNLFKTDGLGRFKKASRPPWRGKWLPDVTRRSENDSSLIGDVGGWRLDGPAAAWLAAHPTEEWPAVRRERADGWLEERGAPAAARGSEPVDQHKFGSTGCSQGPECRPNLYTGRRNQGCLLKIKVKLKRTSHYQVTT
jgi:hypothetical protein